MGRIFKSNKPIISSDHPSLGHSILDHLDKNRDRVLLIDATSGKEWTGGQLREKVVNCALGLVELLGLKPGDVCSITYENVDITLILALSIVVAGGVVACQYWKHLYPELLHVAQKTKPKFFFCHSSRQSWAKQLEQDIGCKVKVIIMDNQGIPTVHNDAIHIDTLFAYEPTTENSAKKIPVDVGDVKEAIAFIIMTSGTTGRPKAIASTHVENMVSFNVFKAFANNQVISSTSSLDYASARIVLLLAIHSGSKLILINSVDPEEYLKAVQRYRVGIAYIGSALYQSIITCPNLANYDISSVRIVFPFGAGITSPKETNKFLEEHPNIEFLLNGYGMSEKTIVSSIMHTPEHFKADPYSSGPLEAGVEVKIVDLETGHLLDYNQRGVIHVKWLRNHFKGYFHAGGGPDGSNYFSLPGVFDSDGFYITRDVGYMGSNDQLYVEGRMDETIVCSSSKKVLPQEIESILLTHELVSEAYVIGIRSKINPVIYHPRAYVVLEKRQHSVIKDTSSNGGGGCGESRPANSNGQQSNGVQLEKERVAKQILDDTNKLVGCDRQLTGGLIILESMPMLKSVAKADKQVLKNFGPPEHIIYFDQSD